MTESVGLLVEFKAKYDTVSKGFQEVSKGGQAVISQNKKVENSFTAIGTKATLGLKAAVGGFSLLSGAMLAGITGLYAFTGKIGETIDHVTDAARGLGVSAAEFQKLSYAASLGGVGINSIGDSLKKFNINVGQALSGNQDAIDSFKAIGVSVDQLKGKDLTQQFLLSATAAGNLKDKNQAAAASAAVFGRSYTDALSLGRDGIAENVKEFDKLGATLTESQRKAVDAFGDSKTKLSTIFDGFTQKVVADISPAFTQITEQVSQFIIASGGLDGVATKVGNTLTQVVNFTIDAVKGIGSIFGPILTELGGLIISAKSLANQVSDSASGNRKDGGGFGGFLEQTIEHPLSSLSNFWGQILGSTLSGGSEFGANGYQAGGTYSRNKYYRDLKIQNDLPANQIGAIGLSGGLLSGSGSSTSSGTSITTSADNAAKSLNGLGDAALKSSDLITQGFKSLDSKGTSEELSKIFDIIDKNSDPNAGKGPNPNSDFAADAANLLQSLKDGQTSTSAYNAQLALLSKESLVDRSSGFDTRGQRGVIDEIQKYASSLGVKPQQVEVGITVTPSKDFIIKVAENSYTTITDTITQYAANAARLGAKS